MAPAYSGQGIGTQLLQHLLQTAQTLGLDELRAEASVFSKGLFLRLGFEWIEREVLEIKGVGFERDVFKRVLSA